MEHHVSAVTRIVNQHLGQYAMVLLNWLHIQPRHAGEPIQMCIRDSACTWRNCRSGRRDRA